MIESGLKTISVESYRCCELKSTRIPKFGDWMIQWSQILKNAKLSSQSIVSISNKIYTIRTAKMRYVDEFLSDQTHCLTIEAQNIRRFNREV